MPGARRTERNWRENTTMELVPEWTGRILEHASRFLPSSFLWQPMAILIQYK